MKDAKYYEQRINETVEAIITRVKEYPTSIPNPNLDQLVCIFDELDDILHYVTRW